MNKFLFPKIAWVLLLLIPFVFLGFYPTYFSVLLSPINNIYHLHAFFMMLWVAIAILQPFLIQQKKNAAHQLVGKMSYGIMPLVFITGYLVIQHSYYTNLDRYTSRAGAGTSHLTSEEVLMKAAASVDIGLIYFIWLFTFYLLAVINRRKILLHATYMFAATLTVLGPSVDRLIYTITSGLNVEYNFVAQNAVLTAIVVVLLSLLVYQKRKGFSIKPVCVALTIYLAGIGVLFSLPNTSLWTFCIELIL